MKYFRLYGKIYRADGEPIPATKKEKGGLMVKPVGKVTQRGIVPATDQRAYRMDWPLHPLSQAEYYELEELPKELQA